MSAPPAGAEMTQMSQSLRSLVLEGFDRAVRLDLLKKEAIAEHIARTALARVIGETALWQHFGSTPALAAF